MLREDVRLKLRALYKIFYVEDFKLNILSFFRQPAFVWAQRQLNDGVLPATPVKVLIKDLNQVDLKFYTYSSSRSILKKHKVL